MPQIIGTAGQSGGGCGAEGQGAGSMPCAAVAAFAERAAAGAAEQPAIGCGAVAAVVVVEHGDQDRRYRHDADGSFGLVLEAALFVAGAVAGPRRGGAGSGPGQGEQAPAAAGQVAVGQAAGGVAAAEVMTKPAVTIHQDAPVPEAARLIQSRKVKRRPVADDGGRLRGIVKPGRGAECLRASRPPDLG